MKYDHKQLEEKWHDKWVEDQQFYSIPDNTKNKLYLLFAFPYPSGAGLHVGHVESMTALDILARYYRMKGKKVFFPIGWDAFGLPAENYAVQTGTPPEKTTVNAIDTFRRQIKRLAISYTWDHEIATSHPGYYQWTQWLFLKFYEKGLAYKKPGTVNWCPGCQTVLANEQVVDGRCERSGDEVTQKELDQWYFKITDYKDELISGLEEVDWPAATEQQQLNWIGKSEGLIEKWQVKDTDITLETFSTWPHTTWGATFIVIAPEHKEIINKLVKGTDKASEVKQFAADIIKEKTKKRFDADRDKKGIFTGRYAINPLTGWDMPIYVANFAIMDVGTGIVKGSAAHDERDFEFARKYKLPIAKVIDYDTEFHSVVIKKSVSDNFTKDIEKNGWYYKDYEGWGWGVVVPAGSEDKYNTLVQKHLKKGPWYVHTDGSQKVVVFKDIIFDYQKDNDAAKDHAKSLGIPDRQMDWDDYKDCKFCYVGEGTMVNAGFLDGMDSTKAREEIIKYAIKQGYGKKETTYKLRDWLISRQRYWGAPIPIVYDPKGKPHAVKEEHLPWMLPTDVDYNPKGTSPLGSSKELKARVEKLYGQGWTPEIDTMDTFVDSSWYYMRYLSARDDKRFVDPTSAKDWLPVDFYMIGPEHIVLHLLYSRFFTKFLRDQGYLNFNEPFTKMRHQGMILGPDHKKMSKSKGNVINPDEVVEQYGADTLRMYEMFMGPIEADKPWDVGAVSGVNRFLNRVHQLMAKKPADSSSETTSLVHKTLKKVGEDIVDLKFNTAIAAMMEMLNAIEANGSKISASDRKLIAQMLAPFAPYLAEELWHQLGEESSIHESSWPKFDSKLIVSTVITIVIQINGKTRVTFTVKEGIGESEVIEMAKKQESAKKWLKDKTIKKQIYIAPKGRQQGLVNFVV